MSEGIISPEEEALTLGKVGAVSGNIASRNVARRRGFLVSQGFGESIAGEKFVQEPGLETQRQVTAAGKDIALTNVRSKTQASETFARMLDEFVNKKRIDDRESVAELVSGVAGAAQQGFGAFIAKGQLDIQAEALGLREEQIISYRKYRQAIIDARGDKVKEEAARIEAMEEMLESFNKENK